MATQKINVRGASTGLSIADDQISGNLTIGSNTSRSGYIVLGNENSGAFTNVQGGNVRIKADNDIIALSNTKNVSLQAPNGEAKLDGGTIALVASSGGDITAGSTQTSGSIYLGNNINRTTGDIVIGAYGSGVESDTVLFAGGDVWIDGATNNKIGSTGGAPVTIDGSNIDVEGNFVNIKAIGTGPVAERDVVVSSASGEIQLDAVRLQIGNDASLTQNINIGVDPTMTGEIVIGNLSGINQTRVQSGDARLFLSSRAESLLQGNFVRVQAIGTGVAGESKDITLDSINGKVDIKGKDDVTIESTSGTTYLGATTTNHIVKIGEGCTTQGVAIGGNMTSGGVFIGGSSQLNTGKIQLGGALNDAELNARVGRVYMEALNGDVSINASSKVEVLAGSGGLDLQSVGNLTIEGDFCKRNYESGNASLVGASGSIPRVSGTYIITEWGPFVHVDVNFVWNQQALGDASGALKFVFENGELPAKHLSSGIGQAVLTSRQGIKTTAITPYAAIFSNHDYIQLRKEGGIQVTVTDLITNVGIAKIAFSLMYVKQSSG